MGKLIVSTSSGKYFLGKRRSGKRGRSSVATVAYLPYAGDTADMLSGGDVKPVDLGWFATVEEAWNAIHQHQKYRRSVSRWR